MFKKLFKTKACLRLKYSVFAGATILFSLDGIPAHAIEIIKDNSDAAGVTITGSWTASTTVAGHIGANYLHDGNAGKGTKSVRFTPTIPTAGQYFVYGKWSSGADRAAAVPFSITYAGGTAALQVNEQINGGQWFLLGAYNFNAGTGGSVLISTTGTSGYVIVDAVRFVSGDEIIKDNNDTAGVTIIGSWSASTSVTGYLGSNYIQDGNTGKGAKSVRFSPTIPSTGSYSTYLRWTSGSDRASNVPVSVNHSGGTALLQVNQQIDGGRWVLLGVYNFTAGSSGSILIANEGTTKSVIVDAVRLVPGQPDQDGDGMSDIWETANSLNPNNANDGSLDPDGDGLTNLQEYQAGTNPNVHNSSASTVTASIDTENGYEKEGTAAKVRINRTNGTGSLTVQFTNSGTAGAGDYTTQDVNGNTLNGSVTLPSGITSAVIVLTPVADAIHEYPETATITISPSAGYTVGSVDSVSVKINDATNAANNEQLFVAYLAPVPGSNSTASGLATMLLNGSKTSARVSVTFNGLTSIQTNAYIRYGITAGVGPELRPNMGVGQLTDVLWNIVPVTPYTGQQIIDALFQVGGKWVYTNIGSGNFPAGEIQGTWARQTGSSTFSPPPASPPIPVLTGDDITRDVARFLTQATFGATKADIDALVTSVNTTYSGDRIAAFNAWIDTQLGYDQTLLHDQVWAEKRYYWNAVGIDPYTFPGTPYPPNPNPAGAQDGWWLISLQARDQLRQRYAFAISEIFVISDLDVMIQNNPAGMGRFYDMLGGSATGQFRALLEDVSKSPIMGQYLSSLKNQKAVLDGSGNVIISPDENYAREIMQLFSIGLVQLQPDGRLKLGANGKPLFTYNYSDISNLARVFTGWSFGKCVDFQSPTFEPKENTDFYKTDGTVREGFFRWMWTYPMKNFAPYHDAAAKTLLGSAIPAGLDGEADLDAALNIIANHPNVGPFISRLLIQRLVTSNPSAGYIYRVAQKFENNGAGVRGDMKAVLKAILLDYEARTLSLTTNITYGKQKEPLLRYAQLLRACGAKSNYPLSLLSSYMPAAQYDNFPAGTTQYRYRIYQVGSELGQLAQRAPSVFNWFLPDYNPGGAIGNAGLVAPEMQITTESNVYRVINYHRVIVFGSVDGEDVALLSDQSLPNIRLDLSPLVTIYDAERSAGRTVTEATTKVLDYLDVLMMSGNFKARYAGAPTPNPRSIIINGVSGMPLSTTLLRMQELLYQVVSSPEYVNQK